MSIELLFGKSRARDNTSAALPVTEQDTRTNRIDPDFRLQTLFARSYGTMALNAFVVVERRPGRGAAYCNVDVVLLPEAEGERTANARELEKILGMLRYGRCDDAISG